MNLSKKMAAWLLAASMLLLLAACSTPDPADNTSENSDAISAETQWSNDPIVVSSLGGDENTPQVVSTSNGDFYVAWYANPTGENYDVRLQKFDAGGSAQWDANGILVSGNPSDTWVSSYIFTLDADENPILIFQDMRTGQKNIFAYNISPDGEMLWGADGIQLTDNRGFTAPEPTAVVSAEAITFVWQEEPRAGNSHMVMQALDPNGSPLLGDAGLVLPGQEDGSFIQGSLTAGDDGSVILVYGIQTDSPQIMSIYAQKYDTDGNPLWNDGAGVAINDAVPFSSRPALVADGSGGAYLAWHNTNLVAQVQHVDSGGELTMAAGGQGVTAETTNVQVSPQPLLAADGNSVLVFWMNADGTQSMNGLAGQSISAEGELLWGNDGQTYVELGDAPIGGIVPEASGDQVMVVYEQGTPDPADQGGAVMALLVDADGSAASQPQAVTSAETAKQDLGVAAIGAQAWVAVWSETPDSSNAFSKEIMAQYVGANSAE